MRKKVYFLRKERNSDSCLMRAEQVAEGLKSRAFNVEVLRVYSDPGGKIIGNGFDISHIKNSIVILVKAITPKTIVELHHQRNVLIWDVCDTFALEPQLKFEELNLIDEVVLPNLFCWSTLKKRFSIHARHRVIHHHAFKNFMVSDFLEFRLCYYGSLNGTSFLKGEINNLKIIESSFPHWVEIYSKLYSCHYSVREKEFSLYKPNTKISVAASCGAAIIATRDPSFTELVGLDYPFFTNSDYSSVIETIKFVNESFGGPVWREALNMLDAVRIKTAYHSIINDYEKMLLEWS